VGARGLRRPGPPGHGPSTGVGAGGRPRGAGAGQAGYSRGGCRVEHGLIAWEAFTAAILAGRPSFPERWCLRDGEPAARRVVLADVPGRLPRGHAAGYRGATCLWQRGTAHLDSWRSVCQWRRREPGGEL